MTLSGGEKAFLTFDVSGGPGRPSYELVQLDENPGRPMYGWLILEKNPQKPGRGFVDVFTGTQEQREKLFGQGNTGLQISHAALKYSGELAHILKRHGSLHVPHGRYGYDMGTLSDLWREGVDENNLDGFGFEIGDNGLVDASAITLSYARSALSEKISDPLGWLGLAAAVALFASGEAVVVGGLSLLGIGGTAISSDEYSATWDRGESHSWRAEDALKKGDRRGANLHLVEMAARRGLVLGGAADFVIKAGVASGAARFVSAESVPTRAGAEAPVRAGADTAGRPIRWASPDEAPPTEMPLPGGSGTTTGSGGATTVNGGLQVFGYVPGRTRTVTGPGGLQTETYQPPVYLGLEDILPLVGKSVPTKPIVVPDTPAVSAQSPLPAFIIPPLGDGRDPSVVEYEMPGGETGVIFVPGIDDSREAIGDRPENAAPIGDAPSRAERIGDPAVSHRPIFAPGTDNRTRFAAGGAGDDIEEAGVSPGDKIVHTAPAHESPDRDSGGTDSQAEEPDWNDAEAVADWISGQRDRINEIIDEGVKKEQLSRLYGRLLKIPSDVVDRIGDALEDDDSDEAFAFSNLISAGHSRAIEKLLEIAADENSTAGEHILDQLEKLVFSLSEIREGHPITDVRERLGLIRKALEFMFASAEKGSANAAKVLAFSLCWMFGTMPEMKESDRSVTGQSLKWATGKLLLAKIPLPERLSTDENDFNAMPVGDLAEQVHLPAIRKLAALAANGDVAALNIIIERLDFVDVAEFLRASFEEMISGHPQAREIQKELFRIVRLLVKIRDETGDGNSRPLHVYTRLYAKLLVQTINASDCDDKSGELMKVQRIIGDRDMRIVDRWLEQDAQIRDAPARRAAAILESEITRVTDKLMSLAAGRAREFGDDFSGKIEAAADKEDRRAALEELKRLATQATVSIEESAAEREVRTRTRRAARDRRGERMAAYAARRAARETTEGHAESAGSTAESAETKGPAPVKEPTPLERAIVTPPETITAEEIRVMTDNQIVFENGGWKEVSEFYDKNPSRRSSFFVAVRNLLTGDHTNIKRIASGRYRDLVRIRVGRFRMIFERREGTVVIKAMGDREEIYKRR